jgi:phage/plasmid-associated DNA primase
LLSHSDIAKLLHILLQHKYVTDVPEEESKVYWYEFILDDDDHIDGELYKWYKWKTLPTSLDRYISEVLPNLFEMVFINVKKNFEKSTGDINKYYNKVLQNFKATMRKLGDRFFKKNVIEEAAVKFSKRGFDYSLDKNPLIRGVQNGVLKMSHVPGGKPLLIQGYHTHPISKYTKVPYIPFNPYDPLTKKILIALRNLFPDNEPDSFEFYMSYLSSTADGNPKESMFMMMVGKGSNGKTFSVELHKSAIGDIYGVKMPLSYLTAKDSNPENATPVEVMLKDATFAYYSESNKNEVLNAAKIKRVTGLETLGGRKLNCNYMMFKPKCHHLVTTNFDFDVLCDDHGTWRRIVYVPLKMTFVDTSTEVFDPNDPNQRIADSTLAQGWTEDPEVQGRYYGIMIWYNYWLYRKYKGKVKSVPHPHIQYETEKYRRRQNALSAFLAQRFVKLADKNYQSPMTEEIQKYIKWYTVNYGNSIPAKGVITLFQNSQIGKHIITTQRGIFMKGYKFLDNAEQLNEGEEYAMKNVFDIDVPEDNFGIEPETPDQFYSRICSEYDQYKNIFDGKPVYDIDPDNLVKEDSDVNIGVNIPQKNVRKSNIEIDGRILPSGIVLRVLEEPNIKYNNNFDMKKYMPVNSDNESDLEVEDEEIEVESEKSEVESEKSEEENEKSEEESQEESDAESDAESEVNTSVESDAESDVDDPDYFPNIGVDNSSLFKSKKHK